MVVKCDLLGLDAVFCFEHRVNDVHQFIFLRRVASDHRRELLVLFQQLKHGVHDSLVHRSALGNISGIVASLLAHNVVGTNLVGNRRAVVKGILSACQITRKIADGIQNVRKILGELPLGLIASTPSDGLERDIFLVLGILVTAPPEEKLDQP